MEIIITDDPSRDERRIVITISGVFVANDCEPYGPPEICKLITDEQGLGIIEDAVLMAMRLRRIKRDHSNDK